MIGISVWHWIVLFSPSHQRETRSHPDVLKLLFHRHIRHAYVNHAEDGVQMYTKLQKEGRVRDVLENMYAWGKQHAWDASALKDRAPDSLGLNT